MDGFALEVVLGFDEADRAASCPHENGMSGSDRAPDFHSAEQRAAADSRRRKDQAFSAGEVLRHELRVELVSPTRSDERLLLGFIPGPDLGPHPAAEASQSCRREHPLGTAPNTGVEINRRNENRGTDDVARAGAPTALELLRAELAVQLRVGPLDHGGIAPRARIREFAAEEFPDELPRAARFVGEPLR